MSLLRSWTDIGPDGTGLRRPVLVRTFATGWRAVSTAILGGGLGPVAWWVNAQVSRTYAHPDPVAHGRQLAAGLGLSVDARGVVMLTAADASRYSTATEDGVEVVATVGLGLPVPAAAADEVDWAAAGHEPAASLRPGTINLLVTVPVPLSGAALVNAVVTATEAKTQALVEAGVPGTGTSSDAVCVACPAPAPDVAAHPYGGPRSLWGARLARAVHDAVAAGTTDWVAEHPPGDEHRRWGAPWPHMR